MRLGLGLSLSKSLAAGSSFDPATLALSGWWKAPYSGSPWVDNASAGSSGANNFTEATNPPSPGTAVNGFAPVAFDGVNDILTGAAFAGNAFFQANQYGLIALLYVDSFTIADPGNTAPYNCAGVLADPQSNSFTGGIAGSGASGVFRYGHFNSTAWASAAVAISSATWTMIAVSYDGTTISASKNAGAASTQNQTPVVGSLNGSIKFAPGFSGAKVNARFLECATKKTAWTAGELAGWKSYFNSRYALSL